MKLNELEFITVEVCHPRCVCN